jgi:uncharacterized protein (TIGR03083 family)
VHPAIDHLERTWRSLTELCRSLDEDDWKRPTGCPGWSVQDNVSHLVDYEARALGRPGPEHEVADADHLRNDLGRANEVGVDHRREWPGERVLEEFEEVTTARLARLRSLDDEALAAEVDTPAGRSSVGDALALRLMDTWSHEQDIRRALGRPGHVEGEAARAAVRFFTGGLPFVVGKKAAAPDGSTVAFEVDDLLAVTIEVVDGRAREVDAAAVDEPSVRLRLPVAQFAALVGGRSDADPGAVTVEGDEELGRRVVANLGFLP